MTAWSTTRCTRCLDVIEPGVYHRCSPKRGYEGLANPKPPTALQVPKPKPPRSDPATLRAMAERWRPLDEQMPVIGGRVVSEVLDELADAMEEAE